MNRIPEPPTLLDLLHICLQLREDEREQWQAITESPYDADIAAATFMLKGGPKFVLRDEHGTPYCAGGYESVGPGVMQSWMIGTPDGWSRHWKQITRASRRVMDAIFEHTNTYRLQTNCLAKRTLAMKWYGALGLKHVRTLEGFTECGEALACFAIEKEASHVRGE